tara:strand:- start:6831 stop:7124 length:294 start_codon:yes stop_codon:yes gene_type:complete
MFFSWLWGGLLREVGFKLQSRPLVRSTVTTLEEWLGEFAGLDISLEGLLVQAEKGRCFRLAKEQFAVGRNCGLRLILTDHCVRHGFSGRSAAAGALS